MSTEESKVILSKGVSLFRWIGDLQAALVRRRCIGNVFHDIEGIPPVSYPIKPTKDDKEEKEYRKSMELYELALMTYQGEIEARSILSVRIDKEIRPPNFLWMSAKQLYEHVMNVREEGANTPWEISVRNILGIRLTSTADQYCNEFMLR